MLSLPNIPIIFISSFVIVLCSLDDSMNGNVTVSSELPPVQTRDVRTKMPELATASILAGNGVGGIGVDKILAYSTNLLYPTRSFQDSDGNIFISDGFARVLKVDTKGYRTTLVSGRSGFCYGIDGDSRNFYVGYGTELLSFSLFSRHDTPTPTRIAGGGSRDLTIIGQSIPGLSVKIGRSEKDLLDVWIDQEGNKFVSSSFLQNVYKINSDHFNTVTLIAQVSESIRSITGDNRGFIYFGTDYYIYQMQVIVDNNYVVTTFMGIGSKGYTPDGSIIGLTTPVYNVMGLAIDPEGNLYISEAENLIRKITSSNKEILTVVEGLMHPYGIKWDGRNVYHYNLFICDADRFSVLNISFS